jgi:hypothetical protein
MTVEVEIEVGGEGDEEVVTREVGTDVPSDP